MFPRSALTTLAVAGCLTTLHVPDAGAQTSVATQAAKQGAAVTGKIESSVPRGKARWFVYISDLPAGPEDRAAAARGKYHVDQIDTQFTPSVLVVPVHANVKFPNNDKFFHNVFSMSKPNIFDLGLYRGGESKSVKMRKAGEVDVYCNIHPQMHMKILVVPNRFFTEVGPDGTFSLEGVPAGSYTLTAWSTHHEPVTTQVTVGSDGVAKASMKFTVERSWNKRHLRKDGSQYGRYE